MTGTSPFKIEAKSKENFYCPIGDTDIDFEDGNNIIQMRIGGDHMTFTREK